MRQRRQCACVFAVPGTMPAGGGETRTAGSGDKRSHAAAGELSSYLPELKLRKDELVPPPSEFRHAIAVSTG